MPIPAQPTIRPRSGTGSRWTIAILVILFLAIRIPLLRGGFGSDDDAWRNAANALRVLEEHRYVPSQAPGSPAYDAVLIALILLGPVMTNLASVAFQALACAGVWWLERRAGFARPGLVAAALVGAAPFAVGATQTMDYALSAALLVVAYVFLVRDKSRRTGLFVGLATGARAGNVLALPAALLDSWLRRRAPVAQPSTSRTWSDRNLIVTFALTVAALFTPVVLAGSHPPQSGDLLGHVTRHHANAQNVLSLERGLIAFLLGRTALLWIGLGLLAAVVRRARAGARTRGPEGAPVFELTCIVLATLLSFAVPSTPASLLPVFPLILLFLRRLLPAWAFAGLAVMLAVELVALPRLSERRVVPGGLLIERSARHEQNERTTYLRERTERPTVRIVTRPDLHRLLFSNPPLRRYLPVWEPIAAPGVALAEVDGSLQFADSLSADDRARLGARGFAIVDARGDAVPTRMDPRNPNAKAARLLGF